MFLNNWKVNILIVFSTISFFNKNIQAQSAAASNIGTEEAFIRNIYSQTLTDGRSYAWLETLCKSIGQRLSGSPQAAKAVEWVKNTLDTLHLDSVWIQPVMVPHWTRGERKSHRDRRP